MATYGHTFTSGDTLTPTKLNAARTATDIVNADIKSDAAIAGTKIAPDFGAQNVTTTGRIAGGSAPRTVGGTTATVESHGTTGARFAATRFTADTSGSIINLFKSRGAAVGTRGIVQSGDTLYALDAYGDDGANDVIAARILAQVDGTPGTNDMPGRLVFSTTADGASSVTERMRITSGGAVCIGTTENIDAFEGTAAGTSLAGGAVVMSRSENTALRVRRVGNDGAVVGFNRSGVAASVGVISVSTTSTSYGTSSDYRLKENSQPMTAALSRLCEVKPVMFTWKSNGKQSEGFIAHELQAVVPEAVTGEKDAVDAEGKPEYQNVDAAKIVPLLVAAVQELSAKVAALEAAQINQ